MGNEIINILQGLNEAGSTIVMVTHDESMARRTGRLIRLYDGAQVADSRLASLVV
jgi:putative ABC transport system ATP-binding protein